MWNLVYSLKREICVVPQENNELKTLCEKYSTVVYQMGHATEDMTELTQRTVVQPMKKLSSEFPSIQVSYLSNI
jgi:hypothetical protein